MKIGELKEILAEYPDELEIKIASDRYTGPYATSLRGLVYVNASGPVYFCADYDSKRIEQDPWSELDGPRENDDA